MSNVTVPPSGEGTIGPLVERTWFFTNIGNVELTTDIQTDGSESFRNIPTEPGIIFSAGLTVRYRNPRTSESKFGYMTI